MARFVMEATLPSHVASDDHVLSRWDGKVSFHGKRSTGMETMMQIRVTSQRECSVNCNIQITAEHHRQQQVTFVEQEDGIRTHQMARFPNALGLPQDKPA